jgi:molecular chaperone DnaK
LLLDAALVEANMTACDIDRIILVGGSTRIPVVQKRLEERFSFAPEITINVDECVALGAALHAGLTFQREKPNSLPAGITNGLRDIKLTDVCNHSFGTICAPFDSKIGSRVIRNQIILKKNTPLPCEVSQTFYTMNKEQKKLEVTVTQGEDTAVEYVNIIATHTIDLPPGRSAKRPIKVTYSYDISQRMHCKFEDVESGKVHELDLAVDKDGKLLETAEKEDNNQLEALKIE